MKRDKCLEKFVDYCKENFGGELVAILIYGSYAFGYFDKKKSDYDLIVIFKDKVPRKRAEIKRKFKKVNLPYFFNEEDLLGYIGRGHWTLYITLMKSAGILYKTKEYDRLFSKLKKRKILKELDVAALEIKTKEERNILKRRSGFQAVKWALPMLRKRLQLLTYVRKNKLVWDLKENLEENKDVLDDEEIKFIRNLDKRVKIRDEKFSREDKNKSIEILDKLFYDLIIGEISSLKL